MDPVASTSSSLRVLYVGTYTAPGSEGLYKVAGSEGIYAFQFEEVTGRLIPIDLAAPAINPSFLCMAEDGSCLYAVNERRSVDGGGTVSAYRVDPVDSRLTFLNAQPSGGGQPVHLTMDRSGRTLFAANYERGSFGAWPISPDGRLEPHRTIISFSGSGPHPLRQTGPHAHCTVFDPSGHFLLVSDLGSDRVMIYRHDASDATLSPADPAFVSFAPGSGPRHLVFAPSGQTAYVVAELTSEMVACRWLPEQGRLIPFQAHSTLPRGWTGSSTCSALQLDRSGQYLYASNRGHDSIAVFRTGVGGAVEIASIVPCGGRRPRSFILDPSERYLLVALQDSHRIQVFARDLATGLLTETAESAAVFTPACLIFGRPEAAIASKRRPPRR